MLPASARLRASDEIRAVVRNGRRATVGELTLHAASLATRTGAPAAAALIVPKRVGNAVVRNTVARRIRHALRERLTLLPAGSGLVVRVGPGADRLSFPTLSARLDDGLRRVAPRA